MRCGQYFDGAIGTGAELDNLDALMGKAKVLEGKRQWVQALDALNKVWGPTSPTIASRSTS